MAVKISVYGTADMRQIDAAKQKLAALEAQARASAGGFSGSMARMSQTLTRTGAAISATGTTLTRNLSLPLGVMAGAAIKTAADFEVAMKSVQVNAGVSGKELENLRGLALQMGADTVFSAGEAANAMLELSKGGLSAATIQGGALQSTMNLAATEGMALADAATIVVQSMNTFGLSASETAKAVDILAAGAVASTAGVADLASGLKFVGSTASNLRVPMADTVTALASLNNAGIDSTTAGTSLNRMLLGLAGTTKKGSETIKQFGLDFFDANGQLRPMVEVVAELQGAFGTLDDQTRTIQLKNLFGVEGARAATVLIKEGVQGYEDLAAAVGKSGVAGELANARMSGLAGVIEQLKGSIDTALIQQGTALQPLFTTLATSLTGIINVLAGLPAGTQEFIAKIIALGIALGPTVKLVGMLTQGLGGTIKGISKAASIAKDGAAGFSNLVAGLKGYAWNANNAATPALKFGNAVRSGALSVADFTKKLALNTVELLKSTALWVKDTAAKAANTAATIASTVAQKAAAAATKAWAAVQWLLNAALTANPIGLVVAAVAALVAAFVIAYKRSETFRNLVTAAFDAVKRAASAVWDWLKRNWPTLLAILTGPIGAAVLVIVKNWDKIKGAFTAAWNAIKRVASNIAGTISGLAGQMVRIGRDIVEGLWNGIKAAGSWLREKVTGWARGILDNIKSTLGISSPSRETRRFGGYMAEGMAAGIVAGMPRVTAASTALWRASLRALNRGVPEADKTGKRTSQAYASGLVSDLRKRLDQAQDDLDKAKQEMIDSLTDQLDALNTRVQTVGDSIDNALQRSREAAERMLDAASDSWKDASDRLQDLRGQATSFAASIRDSLRGVFSLRDALNPENGGSFLGNLRKQFSLFRTFSGQIRDLRAMGLNEASMQEIIAAGVEQGTQIAAAILAGGSGAIAEINQLESMITAQAAELGGLFAQDKFGAELAKAEENLRRAAESLDRTTRARDNIVAQIDAAQSALDQMLGRQMSALDAMADQLSRGIGDTEQMLANILGMIRGELGGLGTLVSERDATQSALNAATGERTRTGTGTTASTASSASTAAAQAAIDKITAETKALEANLRKLDRQSQQLANLTNRLAGQSSGNRAQSFNSAGSRNRGSAATTTVNIQPGAITVRPDGVADPAGVSGSAEIIPRITRALQAI